MPNCVGDANVVLVDSRNRVASVARAFAFGIRA
jgi:hypothetical protein